ncbi:MAG TPA: class I SAM-dependent methyltransferase [Vicinamibacteria bacterium]|nr:class I SAM-dependent methyltransferase [Vicinamibacteria bacterium]
MRGVEQIPWLYDLGMSAIEATGLGRWRAWLVKGTEGRVLDVGCGTGRNLGLLLASDRPVGVDPCLSSLLAARRRAPDARLVRARAEALPFRDGVFDTVLSGLVFCSVGDPPRGLREVRRVLRPGGGFRLLEHVRAEPAWQAWLQDRVQPLWTWVTGGCRPNRETERTVEAAGFLVDPGSRRARGTMRRWVARPR